MIQNCDLLQVWTHKFFRRVNQWYVYCTVHVLTWHSWITGMKSFIFASQGSDPLLSSPPRGRREKGIGTLASKDENHSLSVFSEVVWCQIIYSVPEKCQFCQSSGPSLCILGMGPGPLKLGKIASLWIKLGKISINWKKISIIICNQGCIWKMDSMGRGYGGRLRPPLGLGQRPGRGSEKIWVFKHLNGNFLLNPDTYFSPKMARNTLRKILVLLEFFFSHEVSDFICFSN